MKITKSEMKNVEKEIGYICDICKKEVIYEFDFLPERNTITWSHPSGGWGESNEKENIHICSLDCLLKALKRVYYGADIYLSSNFLDSIRKGE